MDTFSTFLEIFLPLLKFRLFQSPPIFSKKFQQLPILQKRFSSPKLFRTVKKNSTSIEGNFLQAPLFVNPSCKNNIRFYLARFDYCAAIFSLNRLSLQLSWSKVSSSKFLLKISRHLRVLWLREELCLSLYCSFVLKNDRNKSLRSKLTRIC